jgi:hypothetical protein
VPEEVDMRHFTKMVLCSSLLVFFLVAGRAVSQGSQNPAVEIFREKITFYAGFDGTVTPEIAAGQKKPLGIKGEPVFTEGRYGKGILTGKGAGAVLSYPVRDHLDFTKPGTISFWMCPVEWDKTGIYPGGEGYRRFVTITAPGKRSFIFIQRHAYGTESSTRRTDHISVLFYYFPGMKNLISNYHGTKNWKDGEWHLLTVNWDTSNYRFYMDGDIVGTTAFDRPLTKEDFPEDVDVSLNIGGGAKDSTIIDELTIYNHSLTDTEIKRLFQVGAGVENILNEPLDSVPSSAVISGSPQDIRPVNGRVKGTKALHITDSDLKWNIKADGNYFIEYWMKPVGWDGLANEEIELTGFKAGGKSFRMYKAKDRSELVLETEGKVLQVYPVYNWTEQGWMKPGDDKERWHYINVRFEKNIPVLSVDGFRSKKVSEPDIKGGVDEYILKGGKGTVFGELRMVKGRLDEEEMRNRYLHLYQGKDAVLLRVSQREQDIPYGSDERTVKNILPDILVASAGDINNLVSDRLQEMTFQKTLHLYARLTGKSLTEEEEDYNRRWSREELMEELRQKEEWSKGLAGRGEGVMSPWTPVEVKGQDINCWGRTYRYSNTIFPSQITSKGEEHLTEAPYITLTQGSQRYRFQRGKVEIKKQNDELVRVNTEATSGPFTLKVEKEYEFDGMVKVTLRLSSTESAKVDSMEMVFPLKSGKTSLYHYIATSGQFPGHPPLTDAGYTPREGFSLKTFRPLVWMGDTKTGFCWFAEGMENWQTGGEKGIQVLGPADRGSRLFKVRLADTQFLLNDELKIVFGMQTTPTRPRKERFRLKSNRSTIRWNWFWGDGAYYPFHKNPAKAKEQVENERKEGREVMPCSSVLFYGLYRFYKSLFGKIEDPGLQHRETILWQPLWRQYSKKEEVPADLETEEEAINSFLKKERHTAQGNWYGEIYKPTGLTRFCVNSPFQDYYVWKLEQLVKDTGLGALYLDQPVFGCINHHHGCGYINHKGERTPTVPIFAMREMAKRIRRVFYNVHGDARIRWHMSNQILVPVVSMADTFWDGENYGQTYGTLWVKEFYSKILSEGRMLAQHTGIQFGFAPDFLPEFKNNHAPTSASVRDMAGLLFIHDSNIFPVHTPNDRLAGFLQDKRLSYDPDSMEVVHYWEDQDLIKTGKEKIRYILHYGRDRGLLILFNWSDEVETAGLTLKTDKLFNTSAGIPLTDIINGEVIKKDGEVYKVSLAPRDLRMLEISVK